MTIKLDIYKENDILSRIAFVYDISKLERVLIVIMNF